MKVLQIITRKQLRGAEIFATQLSEQLISSGHESIIIALYPGLGSSYRTKLEVKELNCDQKKRWFDFKGWRKLANIIDEEKPDLVVANASETLKFTVLSKKIYGWKCEIIFRNASLISGFKPNILKQISNQFLVNNIIHVVSVSNLCRDDFLNTFFYRKSKISMIPIGVELPNGSQTETNNKIGDYARPIFINIASFVPEKNHIFLLEIFEEYIKAGLPGSLLIVGDGPLRKKMEEKIHSSPHLERVYLLGYRQDAGDILSSSDAFLLSSEVEGLPGVILEAMARRIPVVSTAAGGISEIIKHNETGFLCNSSDSFVKWMTLVSSDHQLKKRITENAYTLISENFTLEVIGRRFLSLYQQLLDNNN